MTDKHPVRQFSKEQLLAYLGGDIDAELRLQIDSQLEYDNELQARLLASDWMPQALSVSSEPLLNLAPLERMSERLPRNRSKHWWHPDFVSHLPSAQAMAACFVLVFCLGALTGRVFFPRTVDMSEAPRWITAAIDHTNLYTSATVSSNPLDPEQKKALLAEAGEYLSTDLSRVANSVPGSGFQYAALMEFEGRPLVQLVYLYETGTPYSLYILRADRSKPGGGQINTRFRKGQIEELTATRWDRGSFEFFTVGRLTRAEMDGIAEAVAASFE